MRIHAQQKGSLLFRNVNVNVDAFNAVGAESKTLSISRSLFCDSLLPLKRHANAEMDKDKRDVH